MVIDGVISNAAAWRQKVLSLAERQAASSRAAATGAAAVWKLRAQQLRQGAGVGGVLATPNAASGQAVAGDELSDMLGGAVNVGEREEGQDSFWCSAHAPATMQAS